jgi:periplasmic protein TonB
MEVMLASQVVMKDLRHHVHAWAFSIVLHAVGAIAAVAFLSELDLPAQLETFHWEVALVSKPVPVQDTQEAPQPRPQMPPTPHEAPAKPAPTPIERRVQPRATAETAQVTRAVQHRDVIPVTESVRQIEERVAETVQTVQTNVQPIQEQMQESVQKPVLQERVAQTVATVPANIQPIQEQVQESVQKPVHEVVTQKTQEAEHPPSEIVTPTISRDAVETARVSPPGVFHSPVEQPTPVEAPSVTAEETAEMNAPVQREITSTPAVVSSVPQEIVHHSPIQERRVSTVPQAQADYGWLSAALFSRIEQLKRYPSLARTNHWEGRVVIEAIIAKDGTIMKARIIEGSGHAVLDRDAVTVLERASPLDLKYPLNRSVTLLVPINYRLSH